MSEVISFTKIKKGAIFSPAFASFQENNSISFSTKGIAVIYGPNGAGKTTLAKVLSNEVGTEFELSYDSATYSTNTKNPFHVISDQLGRNIISGSAREYFLGENIKREFELKDQIDEAFSTIFDKVLSQTLSNRFKISTKSNPLVKCIENSKIRDFVEKLVNKQDKGRKIDKSEFLVFLKSLTVLPVKEFNEDVFQYILADYAKGKDSITKKILETDGATLQKDHDFRKLDENDEAIGILQRYAYLQDCVVCDSEIDPIQLLEKKKANKDRLFEALDESTKKILENIVRKLAGPDPLNIRETFLLAIKDGNKTPLQDLQVKIRDYLKILSTEIFNLFATCTNESDILKLTEEYQAILGSKPEILEEDLVFIEQIVNDNIERTIKIDRDVNNNLKIYIGDKELLGTERNDLLLSTGEQNFIPLSFELLKARNTLNKVIVIDDPISSFDSIYKNKIAFSLIRVLSDKKQIILTHNTDLIRLLEHQWPKCFNFYLLNKTPGEVNGFIPIGENEIDILLHIDKFLNLLRTTIDLSIVNLGLFLLAMIPFMRGYAHIVDNSTEYESLTFVMHGYNIKQIDLGAVYQRLFGKTLLLTKPLVISGKEIAELKLTDEPILKTDKYPLLDRTLNHSLSYLYLRLNVEKVLVARYGIDASKKRMLSDIIQAAFSGRDPDSVKRRVFLTSKKTLLNEFNHFEGNMNIFQPAIDITNSALKREKESILKFLADL